MALRYIPGAHDIRLAVELSGGAERPVIILLHGGGQTRHSWGSLVAGLVSDGFLVANVDLRGHGDSGWARDGDYSVDALAEDVRAVAGELGSPVGVVGASMGGRAALLAAGEFPVVACSGLVLVDVTPTMSDEGREQVVRFMRGGLDGFATLEDAASAISRYLPHRPPVSDLAGLEKNLRRGDDGRWRWHWDPALVDPGKEIEDDAPARFERAAAAVAAPLLLVRGGSSELVKPEHAEAFLEAAPGAEYVQVDNAGHMVAGDRNRAFSGVIREFLAR